MLYEFALEPSLLTNWQNVRLYLGKFGVEHGRLISRYPKRWERLVHDCLSSLQPVEKLRFVEALNCLVKCFMVRHHEWDDSREWLDNAEAEHGKRPFHAIIASNNPRSAAIILLDADINESRPSPLWQAARSRVIQRQAADMAAAVKNLLRCSRTVMFVDGNFDPKVSRFRLPLEAFLGHLIDDRTKRPTASFVQYHVGVEQHEAADFKVRCQAWMPSHVPRGMKVEFVLWNPDDLHNRYVITERGAMQFGEGLDQAGTTGRPEDVVSILDDTVATHLFGCFVGTPPRYRYVDRVVIAGTKPV